MKKYTALKLIGLAVLAMITLIILSILEVTLYSYVVNPGQDISVYDAHAQVTAPYVSGICGFIIFFLVARFWKKRGNENAFKLTLLFPATYVLLDILVLLIAGVEWSGFILTFILANGAKFYGSYLGYKLTK